MCTYLNKMIFIICMDENACSEKAHNYFYACQDHCATFTFLRMAYMFGPEAEFFVKRL